MPGGGFVISRVGGGNRSSAGGIPGGGIRSDSIFIGGMPAAGMVVSRFGGCSRPSIAGGIPGGGIPSGTILDGGMPGAGMEVISRLGGGLATLTCAVLALSAFSASLKKNIAFRKADPSGSLTALWVIDWVIGRSGGVIGRPLFGARCSFPSGSAAAFSCSRHAPRPTDNRSIAGTRRGGVGSVDPPPPTMSAPPAGVVGPFLKRKTFIERELLELRTF